MKDDDKDLLFADACARLKYNVKAKYQCFHIHSVQGLTSKGLVILCNETNQLITTNVENIRLFLFPLSSMTEEQREEFKQVSECEFEMGDCGGFDSEGHYKVEIGRYDYQYDTNITTEEFYPNYDMIDWLNANHFDYRGLIEKGLAIDATGLNIY